MKENVSQIWCFDHIEKPIILNYIQSYKIRMIQWGLAQDPHVQFHKFCIAQV